MQLRIRDLTLNRCIDICRSEESTKSQIKSLSEPTDVKEEKASCKFPTPDGTSGRTISCKLCGHDKVPERKKCPAWGKVCKWCKKRTIFAKGCKGKDAAVYAIESDEEQEKIIVVRVQAMKDWAMFAGMLVQLKPVRFQVECGANAEEDLYIGQFCLK